VPDDPPADASVELLRHLPRTTQAATDIKTAVVDFQNWLGKKVR
jgi:hypothetical protein